MRRVARSSSALLTSGGRSPSFPPFSSRRSAEFPAANCSRRSAPRRRVDALFPRNALSIRWGGLSGRGTAPCSFRASSLAALRSEARRQLSQARLHSGRGAPADGRRPSVRPTSRARSRLRMGPLFPVGSGTLREWNPRTPANVGRRNVVSRSTPWCEASRVRSFRCLNDEIGRRRWMGIPISASRHCTSLGGRRSRSGVGRTSSRLDAHQRAGEPSDFDGAKKKKNRCAAPARRYGRCFSILAGEGQLPGWVPSLLAANGPRGEPRSRPRRCRLIRHFKNRAL